MKKLYRINTQFWGKDLNEKAIISYVIAISDEQVADYISEKYMDGGWFGVSEWGDDPEDIEATRRDYINNKGDLHTEYDGEFYDQKYMWEEVSKITNKQIAVLVGLGIAEDATP